MYLLYVSVHGYKDSQIFTGSVAQLKKGTSYKILTLFFLLELLMTKTSLFSCDITL